MSDVRIIRRPKGDTLGEGPLWSVREQALYWVDILSKRLNRLDPASGEISGWDMPEYIGWVIEREDAPGFVAGLKSGIHLLTLDPFSLELVAPVDADKPDNRMNDAKADATGRIWAGSMPFTCDVPTGSLYRFDTDRTLTQMDEGYCVANGPAITADGKWLFHTDTVLGRIYRFALHADGSLGEREVFVQFEEEWGSPDGMAFDAEDGLWVAHWGGSRVTRFLPDGTIDRSIALPASQITCCTFGGPKLDRMYITSAADGVDEADAGQLFEVDAGVRGLPAHRYRG